MLCPGCSTDNPPGSLFCGSCGQPIQQSLAAAAPTDPGSLATTGEPTWVPKQAVRQLDEPAVLDLKQRPHRPDNATTRYLCAGVALSPGLRKRILEGILEEEHRAVITTPGVDLVTVLKYALAAHRRQVIRDVVLLLLLCTMIVSIFVFRSFVVFLLLLAAAWVTVWVERYTNSWGAARNLRPETFSPDKIHAPAGNSYAGRQLQRIAAAGTTGNVTLYSKFPPFVGYGGSPSSSWSFAVDVTRPRRGARPRQFSVHEVYDYVQTRLGELDLAGMEVSSRVFVDGRDIEGDSRFLPNSSKPPVTSIGMDVLRGLMTTPEERARPYLAIGKTSWQGDLVVTIFIRFLLSRSDLFVEEAHLVMPPLRPEFKAIDESEPEMTPGDVIALASGSLVSTIPSLFRSVPGLLNEMGANNRRERKRRQVQLAHNYGALFSVRDVAADNKYNRYFQVLDDARYVKVVEQRIFRSLVEFLEDHDIDASQLEARTEMLVNNGVMVTGGTLNAQAVAAGANARATAGGIGVQATELISRFRSSSGGGEGG
jgi:hypothetical protein